jgi:flagellar biosynthetic protein FlhB
VAEERSDAERKHAPTERRLRKAAERGDLVRSVDLPKAAATILMITIILNASTLIGGRVIRTCMVALASAGTAEPVIAADWVGGMMREMLPLLGLIGLLATAVGILFGGWTFSWTSLLPSFGKALAFSGLGEMFSVNGLTETLKSLLKFIAIGVVGGLSIVAAEDRFLSLGRDFSGDGGTMITVALHVLTTICVAVAGIAATDMAVQFWLYRRRHRMSDEEIREEMKDAVGNPHIRQRQRAAARRMARSRQMRRLPEASVVVTNPTHVAVALRFRKGRDAAPVLLAKGADLMAADIISTARSLGIPIVEAPPLARAVYRYVEPDDYIPVALYRACAEILAYVWRLQAWRSERAVGQKPRPPRLAPIDMPPRYADPSP